ncbi:MAG: serine/threonine protein kinase [Polyangiaceae bacterium]|nr:serine/threonine protein kinase [Polyangiaceae bacterium]
MSRPLEKLQNTLPTPLAQLAKRALAAESPRDAHDGAFYLAEATLKLAAAARVGRCLALGVEPGSDLAKKLEVLVMPLDRPLERPATGHRRRARQARGRPRRPAGKWARIAQADQDRPAFEAFARATEQSQIGSATVVSQARKNGLLGFFDLLVAYRNRVIGHSGQRVPAFYEEVGLLLLDVVAEVLDGPELFGELDLVVPRLQLAGGGATLKLKVLRGLGTSARPAGGDELKAGELYFVDSGGYRAPLSPLVIYAERRDQSESFGFLNGSDSKGKDVVKRVEYLDYATSEPLPEVDMAKTLSNLLASLRGKPVDREETRRTMLRLAEPEAPPELALGKTEAAAPIPGAAHEGDRVGTVVLDKYRVVRKLGEGGMGAVYEVEHTSLETLHALKILSPALARREEIVQRFTREAKEAARTKHPGIVQVTDHGRLEDGSAYLLMELLVGESLEEKISAGPLAIEEVRAIGVAALEALQAAHERGLVHRDIKPDNLFLPSEPGGPKVKVIDFGIAKASSGDEKLTADGAVLGTPAYIAPEQLGSSKDADARADLYAVGATLFACLTGRSPATGSDLRVLLTNVAQGRIDRDPRALRPETPADLAEAIARALELEPAKRFASAREMRAALTGGGTDAAFSATVAGGTLSQALSAERGGATARPARRALLIAGTAGIAVGGYLPGVRAAPPAPAPAEATSAVAPTSPTGSTHASCGQRLALGGGPGLRVTHPRSGHGGGGGRDLCPRRFGRGARDREGGVRGPLVRGGLRAARSGARGLRGHGDRFRDRSHRGLGAIDAGLSQRVAPALGAQRRPRHGAREEGSSAARVCARDGWRSHRGAPRAHVRSGERVRRERCARGAAHRHGDLGRSGALLSRTRSPPAHGGGVGSGRPRQGARPLSVGARAADGELVRSRRVRALRGPDPREHAGPVSCEDGEV